MPPRRRAAAPIPIDVEAVRRKLAEGKIVRVGISRSAQFPEGGTGRVRQVGDPEVDGEEFVQVELSLNGTRDILPFTPADLTPATRAKPHPDPAVARPIPRTKPSRAASGTGATVPPSSIPQPEATVASAPTATAAPPVDPAGPNSSTSTNAAPTAGRVKSPRGARRSPSVSITIATTEPEPTQWRIEARVGARVVLRHGSVSPARVWDLVGQLDEPALITAVGGILDEQRKAAQARADALAAELARVRAELEALPRRQ